MGWRFAKDHRQSVHWPVGLGFIDVNVTNNTSKSGHSQAITTFEDLELALAAFERLQQCKFDHGEGQMHWPSVKWFKGHGKHR